MTIQPLQWKNDRVFLLDQRILPEKELYLECRTYQDVAHAIKCMVVRGAPAVGVAAAMGVALGVRAIPEKNKKEFLTQFDKICNTIASTRPTAVNLFWAIERMKKLGLSKSSCFPESFEPSSQKRSSENSQRRHREQQTDGEIWKQTH